MTKLMVKLYYPWASSIKDHYKYKIGNKKWGMGKFNSAAKSSFFNQKAIALIVI